MSYKTYQSIILLRDSLDINKRNKIISEISRFINQYTKKLEIKNYESLMPLASKIDNCENAWYVAMQFKVLVPGHKKRINTITQQINTYFEVLDFKILEKGKRQDLEQNLAKLYIVYEFDYGDITEGVEARVTIFGAFTNREKANEVAYNLLQEGLEKYYISDIKKKMNNPFTKFNEVELYDNEKEHEAPVYYIKIEEISLNK